LNLNYRNEYNLLCSEKNNIDKRVYLKLVRIIFSKNYRGIAASERQFLFFRKSLSWYVIFLV